MDKIKPFCDSIPSVFIVSTPFQALCAIAVIKQLNIKEYRVIAHLSKGQIRNLQLVNFLNENNIRYVKFTPNTLLYYYYKYKSALSNKSKYTRLFIGNHNDFIGFLRGCCDIANESDIVYLDDGVQSISLFKGALKERMNLKNRGYLNKISNRRHFELLRYFISIYDGIDNPSFVIEKLNLNMAINGNLIRSNGIVIIGIVLEESCAIYNITREKLLEVIDKLFKRLKNENPDSKIIYVPHGRDESLYALDFCNKYGCEFLKCDTMIEIELMKRMRIPKAIIGFTSSALYNLKEIFPSSKYENIVCYSKHKSSIFCETEEISKYYESHGIKMIPINL